MRLIFIRHGQSANNVRAETAHEDYDGYLAARSPEPPLTELGHRQARQLAEVLATAGERPRSGSARSSWVADEHPVTALYTSPMLRALQTTAPLVQALGLTPTVWVDIHEHGGIFTGNPEQGNVCGYPGLGRSAISAQFPGYVIGPGVEEDGWWRGGYEEMAGCYARARHVATTLYSWAVNEPEATVALVTHGTFLDNLFHVLLAPQEEYDDRIHFSHLNTALSRIDLRPDGRLAVRYLNRVDHLGPEWVTR